MKTFRAKPNELEKRWFIVDAADIPLGRTASKVAVILQGKNKPTYTPHVDTGDFVVVINADKVALTGSKLTKKMYHRHTGWVGGLVSKSAKEILDSKPEELIKSAIKGMLPKTTLGTAMLRKLKVHAGPCPEHGYKAQKAQPLDLNKQLLQE
jgi:large subunit ribosomal protein L13